jgi:hypothetical protein
MAAKNNTKTSQENDEEFDARVYAQRLINSGYKPDDAWKIAEKMAETRSGTSVKKIERPQENHEEKQITSQQGNIMDVATDIYASPLFGKDMAFVHAIFCQVGLPRSKVDGREFMRQSGAAWLNVQAGYLDEGDGPVLQSIPYGVLPRLALAHVSTHAVRHRTREIPIGDSAAQFLKMMDMLREGRRYSSLRKQMHALAACRLQLGFRGRTFNGQPVEQFDAWLSNKAEPQRSLWPKLMVLSEHFYNLKSRCFL